MNWTRATLKAHTAPRPPPSPLRMLLGCSLWVSGSRFLKMPAISTIGNSDLVEVEKGTAHLLPENKRGPGQDRA